MAPGAKARSANRSIYISRGSHLPPRQHLDEIWNHRADTELGTSFTRKMKRHEFVQVEIAPDKSAAEVGWPLEPRESFFTIFKNHR